MRPTSVAIIALLVGCYGLPTQRYSPDSGSDAVEEAVLDLALPIHDGLDFKAYRLKYRSNKKSIYGLMCVPKAEGRHGLMLWQHAGFDGLKDEWDGRGPLCAMWASRGFVFAASSFRGEDGSDGNVDICGDELLDARALYTLMSSRDDVDLTKVIVGGEERGACVAAQMAAADEGIKFAFAINGFYDLASWRTWLTEQVAIETDDGRKERMQVLLARIAAVDSTEGGQLERRSPLRLVNAGMTPLFLVHGDAHPEMPRSEACRMRAAMLEKGLTVPAYSFDAGGALTAAPIDGCAGLATALPVEGTVDLSSMRLYAGESSPLSKRAFDDVMTVVDGVLAFFAKPPEP